ARIGCPRTVNAKLPFVIELNLQHSEGLRGALDQLHRDWESANLPGPPPPPTADIYCQARLTINQVQALVDVDLQIPNASLRALYRIWPDFPVQALIDKSSITVKADAAR